MNLLMIKDAFAQVYADYWGFYLYLYCMSSSLSWISCMEGAIQLKFVLLVVNPVFGVYLIEVKVGCCHLSISNVKNRLDPTDV